MAIRRMFSRVITGSTRFLKMPVSSQNLYFHLGMNADDDGVVEAFPVMKMIGANEDDLRVLVGKGFITILNDDWVSFINDWLVNNNIRTDRITDSIYKTLLLEVKPDAKVKKQSNNQVSAKCLTNGGQVSDNMNPNYCQEDVLGKDRLDKDRLGKSSTDKDKDYIDYQQIADMYNNTCVSFPRLTKLSEKRKKAIKARLKMYTIEDFQKLFEMAESSSFLKGQNSRNWSANFDWLTTDTNMAKVLDGNYVDKEKQEGSDSNAHGNTEQQPESTNRRPAAAIYAQYLPEGHPLKAQLCGDGEKH